MSMEKTAVAEWKGPRLWGDCRNGSIGPALTEVVRLVPQCLLISDKQELICTVGVCYVEDHAQVELFKEKMRLQGCDHLH